MERLEHPFKAEIEEVRRIILSANDQLTEHIKWNAPSFCIHGEDRITFQLQGKGFFRLIFHRGAKVKDQTPSGHLWEDDNGLLEWLAPDRATVKLSDRNDVADKREKLAEAVAKWVELTRD
ncbi:DUF1801 domain-containing protein [Cohnella nanjingensis]|nr:DUF1801 domain-containing protein [Cohnella nanjingensis]